jgi:FKBP-type peptidyl-prolyl cis-trans isomerase
MQTAMTNFVTTMRAKIAEKQKEAGADNAKNGQAYLDANKKKDGWKVTSSGLQYKVLTTGTGPTPKATDTVVTNYRGTTIDGTEFDSSYKRNEPAEFPVDKVIPGWTEALQMMPVGSKWQLAIPANLAYGEDAPPQIGPNSVLLFDIELLSIKPPEANPSPSPAAP